jgi:hypothetical protein
MPVVGLAKSVRYLVSIGDRCATIIYYEIKYALISIRDSGIHGNPQKSRCSHLFQGLSEESQGKYFHDVPLPAAQPSINLACI